ncbi:unnamed protein product, partial [Linum tenue]
TARAKVEGCSLLRFQRGRSRHRVKAIKERSFSQPRSHTKSLYVNATSGSQPLESEPGAYGGSKGVLDSVKNAVDAFYRFSRPHTVVGTVKFLHLAVAAALMMNIYIVGLNQLTDIEIDKVNKPYLPLASGEFSVGTGVLIVTSFSIMLPLLRWKRFAFVAALCILAVRAVIVQICFYLHMQPLIFATAFMSFFSVVIALFKDIPDMEGDKIFGIRSFTVQLGQKRVFWTCIALLEIAYGIAMFIGAASPYMWSKGITVIGHAMLALLLWNRAKSVDLTSKTAIASCYMFVWKLFYAEYLLIPLVR